MKQLPIIKIGKKNYFVDERLRQLRNVLNPFDYIEVNEVELFVLKNDLC